MRKCPSCGFRNIDTRETCLKCKASLVERFDLLEQTTPDSPRRAAPANLFYRSRRFLMRWTRQMNRVLRPELPEDIPHRYPFTAAFLALIPGLGQLYNHQKQKALYFFLLCIALFYPAIRHITTPYLGSLLLLLCFLLCMLSYSDALVTAAAINGQRFTVRNRLAALTYPIFIVGMLLFFGSILAWANWPVYTLFVVKGRYMEPELSRGDRVFHEGITYFFRDPAPGDVVRYDPPSYKIEMPGRMGNDIYVMDAMNGWERVMATAGETLSLENGRYYVDGKALSPDYYPLSENRMKRSFSITCPEDAFIVLITRMAETANIANLLGGATRAPDIDTPGLLLQGWEQACIVTREDIRSRAWFIYYPGPRRRFFQSRGPRFAADPASP